MPVESPLNLQSTLTLRDGYKIPLMGLGTYEMEGRAARDAVTWALEAGYRHIDSAAWYYNEKEVGRAILDYCKKSNTPRAEVFFTTKLQSNNGYEATKRAIQKSLDACELGYIDLYLVHSPLGGPEARAESWRAVCEAKAEGKIRSVGVSNYGVKHLRELVESGPGLGLELPVVNQVDLHPFMTRRDIVDYCHEHEIALEAWAPLVRGYRLAHPALVKLGNKYSKGVAQVLVRYSLQKGFICIPKSSGKERIDSNVNVLDFELSEQEMEDLDNLDEYLVTDWDPTDCP